MFEIITILSCTEEMGQMGEIRRIKYYDQQILFESMWVFFGTVFNYKVPAHSVLQVSEIDYISCNYNSPLEKYMSGADSVGPLSAGMYWFICGTPSHCSMGMRMAVPVETKPSLGPPFQLAPPPAPTPPGSSTGTTPPGPMSGDAASSLLRTTSGVLLSPQSFLILAAALHVLLYNWNFLSQDSSL